MTDAGEWVLKPAEPVLDLDRKALEAVEGYEAAQLETVRTKAEKWLGGTTALATVASTVLILDGADSIRDLDDGARLCAGLAVGAAAVCFAVGIWYGYRAAFGTPGAMAQIDSAMVEGLHARLRRAREDAAAESQRWLARAVNATCFGLAALLVVAGASWFGNDASTDTPAENVCIYVDDEQIASIASASLTVEAVTAGARIGPCD